MAGSTQTGVILGTAAYMSPEQARGQELDKRTDIWSFGLVLFEMLAGTSPYRADTLSDTLAGILKEDPNWDALPEETPPQVRRLLRRCLHKEARNRLHDIADARIEIEEAIEHPDSIEDGQMAAGSLADRSSPADVRRLVLVTGLIAGIGGGLLGWWLNRAETLEPAPSVRVQTRLTDGSIYRTLVPSVVLSPDGRNIVYHVGTTTQPELHIRRLDELTSRRLASGGRPFVSPDGAWVGFSATGVGGDLHKVAVTGGTPQTVATISSFAADVRGAAWTTDDTIIYGTRLGGLMRVPAAGGEPEALTKLRDGEMTHRWPWLLPGERYLLFTSRSEAAETFDAADIEVLDLATGQRSLLFENGTDARYVAVTGHIVYLNGTTLYGIPFNPETLEISGTPVAVLTSVAQFNANGGGQYSFTSRGTLAYLSYDLKPYPILQVSRDGTESVLWPEPGLFADPHLSPDGTRLALTVRGDNNNRDIWVHDLIRGGRTRVTTDEGADTNPVFSPDGAYLAFNSDRNLRGDAMEIFRARADGSGEAELLRPRWGWPSDWSDDGSLLAHTAWARPTGGARVAILPLSGDAEPELVAATPGVNEMQPALSPNNRWIAYTSDETGIEEVYVRPYPPADGVSPISVAGGGQPRWRADGRELYFRSDEGIMAVAVETDGATFRHDRPRRLFEGLFRGDAAGMEIAGSGVHWSYDVSSDGERCVMFPAAGDDGLGDAVIVSNWFEELRRLVPVDR